MCKYLIRCHYLVLVIWMIHGNAIAQVQLAPRQVGYNGVGTTVDIGATLPAVIITTGGEIGASSQFHNIGQGVEIYTGFFPGINYYPIVFDKVFVSKGYYSDYVQLSWDVLSLASRIQRFRIYRKDLGSTGDSILVATVPADAYAWRDEGAEKGTLYQYTVFAQGVADAIREPYINYIQEVGFSLPIGTVSGRVTYEGGTAVEGVTIRAEAEGDLAGRSVYLDGEESFLVVPQDAKSSKLELRDGFTMQFWTKFTGDSRGVIFNKADVYKLVYGPGQLEFTVDGHTLLMPFDHPVDSFFHVVASFSPTDGLRLYSRTLDGIDQPVYTASLDASVQPETLTKNIWIGADLGGNFYKGYLDEFRIWNKVLTEDEIKSNFTRKLAGNEDNLIAYWKFDEGSGTRMYDFSRQGSNFNENHGYMVFCNWTQDVPLPSQLSFKGITDEKGNFVIAGFPYEGGGTLYTFTPMLGVHQFDPFQAIRFFGPGTSIINSLDFKDISSFKVSGTVQYRNSYFPVRGVSFLVDNKPAIRNGMLIESDNLGRFEIDVPIGPHRIQLAKNLHTFESDGKFPLPTEEDEFPLFDFQEPIRGLEFIDNTLVKVVGRVVGGPIQSEKPLGFGLSKNNIGNAAIYLNTERGFDVTQSDSTQAHDERGRIASSADFSTKFTTLYPDEATGEYVAYLLPEKYLVTGITAGNYTFDANFHVSLDLQQFIAQEEEHTKVLAVKKGDDFLPGYPPYDEADYEAITFEVSGDTTRTIGIQRLVYEKRLDFINRVTPSIEVLSGRENNLFGDEKFTYKDNIDQTEMELPLIANDSYVFGFPIYTQRNFYSMKVRVSENYFNVDTQEADQVPVTDGRLEIVNNFSIEGSAKRVLQLDRLGEAIYGFQVGLPNTNLDPITPANSFTQTMSLVALTGNNGSIQTVWQPGNPFRAIVFGGLPIGNNFVTKGPSNIIAILRDPPGSDSFTTFEKGGSISKSTSWSMTNELNEAANLTVKFGQKVTIALGVGTAKIDQFNTDYDLANGIESSQTWLNEGQTSETVTTTQTWSTGTGQPYVGSYGDVFIGNSTNIVYGLSSLLQLIPNEQCTTCGDITFNGFNIGIGQALRVNPEFATGFQYSQGFIIDQLLPNLRELRNAFLVYADPNTVNPVDRQVYVSLVPPTDERYGTSNADEVWGSAKAASMTLGNGPSYIIKRPAGWIPQNRFDNDTIQMYNNEIESWTNVLAENEKQKATAKLKENLSFDGGVTLEKSITIDDTDESSNSFTWMINRSVEVNFGQDFNSFGYSVKLNASVSHNQSKQETTTETKTTTWKYVLADGAGSQVEFGTYNDYYSVDVLEPKDKFGPVFKTRGGVSSCPWEGEEKTQFYQPGKLLLNEATLALERPKITVAQAAVSGVPSNRPATFNIALENNSEAKQGVWYRLWLDDTSNPNGAQITIDGEPLTGDGRNFLVPFGQSLAKTIQVIKGRDDVDTYENLKVFFGSNCDAMNTELRDFVIISAYFLPGCSDINLRAPVDQWVINTNSTPADILPVIIDGYDVNFTNFKKVLFQYKPAGSSQWITNMVFYNPSQVSTFEFGQAQEPKAWMDATIAYAWDMSSLPDREYDIRAVSICEPGPGLTYETPTNVHRGRKDVKRPQLFGTPQPGSGVLKAGDDISIRFDEPIEAGLLTPFNFSVTGLLNGYELRHDASVYFDGTGKHMKIPEGLSLNKRSFTVEFWSKREMHFQRQTLFSFGQIPTDALEIGFTASNQVFVKMGTEEVVSNGTFGSNDWEHWGVVYNHDNKTLNVYVNDQRVIENLNVAAQFLGQGTILLGKSIADNTYFRGNIHELRIWEKAVSFGDLYAYMLQALSGGEIGLVGYWPMDEVFGKTAFDKARFRHGMVQADWMVLPKGRSFEFTGANYLSMNTAQTVIISPTTDLTIEFWFKAEPNQTNTVMFSSGKGDGTDVFNNAAWSIGFNQSGKLYVAGNGTMLTLSDDVDEYRNNEWHHVAFSVNRRGNMNVFVNGGLRKSASAAGFGPLFGAQMYLGARGYKVSAITSQFDQHFKGKMDEFRIWKLARTQDQLLLNRNAKIDGDNMGLVAYYPFESFTKTLGVFFMTPSITDQWINLNSDGVVLPNGGAAQSTGGTNYHEDQPNIKQSRPISKVDFTWAVNVDEIIITPAQSMATAIEKSILDITVDRVEDLNENRISGPITWTAYVDRNQLKWETARVSFQKQLYDELSFVVNLVNQGGTVEKYSITNLPAWLMVDKPTGDVAPQATHAVKFTINPNINTGTFQRDVFLTGNFGFNEKLIIDLRVFRPLPSDWVVDASKYQFSMNFVARLDLAGRISNDPNDILAAFVGDECRGLIRLEYVPQYDAYLAFLTVFSNQVSGETLTFKIWDDSEGTIFTNVTPFYEFSSNKNFGVPASPVTFTASNLVEEDIAVPAGWKWISFGLFTNTLSDVNTILKDVKAKDGDQIKSTTLFDQYSGLEKKWRGTISNKGGLKNEEMYKFNVSTASRIRYQGEIPNPSLKPVSIVPGWNWIGFISQRNLGINEALASFNATDGDVIKSQYQLAVYDKNFGWIGNLKSMVPGQGYMLNAKSSGRIVYPELGSLGGRVLEPEQDLGHFNLAGHILDPHQFGYQMSLIGRIAHYSMSDAELTERLVATNEEGIVGIAIPQFNPVTSEYNFFLTLYGKIAAPEELSFYLTDKEGKVKATIVEKVTMSDNKLLGTLQEPFVLHLSRDLEESESSSMVYPNPFGSSAHLEIMLEEPSTVQAVVFNNVGQRIAIVQQGTMEAGVHTLTWNGRTSLGHPAVPGLYYLRVDIDGEVRTHKMIKE